MNLAIMFAYIKNSYSAEPIYLPHNSRPYALMSSNQTDWTTLMRLTIQQLRYFLKTAEIGSVSKAAQALGVSQSTLSEALSQAEATVGFSILSRGRKGVTPTPLGGEFLEYARRVVVHMDALEARFVHKPTDSNKFVISSVSFGFAWEALLKVSRYPGNKNRDICWYLNAPSQVIEMVCTGQAEIGLINLVPGQERASLKMVESAQLEFHELLQASLYAMMAPSHPLASKKIATEEELAEYPFFSVDQYTQTELLREDGQRIHSDSDPRKGEPEAFGIKAPNGIVISPAQLVQNIASANGYTTWCRLLPKTFARDAIVSMPIDTQEKFHIGYVCHKGQHLSEIAEQLLDAIREFDHGDNVPDRLSVKVS